jgi:superfamily II DNA or RNA helicase
LVQSKDLAKQWQAAIKQLTGLDCGLIGGGKWQEGAEFTVATIQTLSKHSGSLDYGMVIVDECHNIPAAQAYKVINQQAAKYRYGLSATPNRRDGLEFMIHAALGKVIAKVEEWELGASVLPVIVNKVDYQLSGFADSWGEYMALLELDLGRNALVINQAIQSSLVIGTVVLTATVSHAETLARLANERGFDALVLHGQLPAKVRAERMAAAPGASLIIGTLSLLSEGIDWPHLGAVVFAAPVSAVVDKAAPSATRLIQSIGRARRPYPGKVRAVVFDVVDQTGFGRAAFNKRLEIYAQQGFGVNTGAVDDDGDFFEVDEEDFDYEY